MGKVITRKRWQAFTVFVLLSGAVWIGLRANPGGPASASRISVPREGFYAPDFILPTLEGETVSLIDLRGKPILINFWASWCPPCRAEMPAIQEQYQEREADGLVVLGVASLPQDNLEDITAFVRDYQLTFPILIDENDQVFQTYRVRSLPTSFFIRPDGIIEEVVVGGPMSEALLRVRITKLFDDLVK